MNRSRGPARTRAPERETQRRSASALILALGGRSGRLRRRRDGEPKLLLLLGLESLRVARSADPRRRGGEWSSPQRSPTSERRPCGSDAVVTGLGGQDMHRGYGGGFSESARQPHPATDNSASSSIKTALTTMLAVRRMESLSFEAT